jgi:microsomal dipeptidase-like Zn-dependent dipeptidase
MMRLGMVIDLDHMSDHSKDRTLEIVWTNQYPVIFSHALGFREMALTGDVPYAGMPQETHYHTSHIGNVPNENHARRSDLEKVRALGGVVSVLLNQPNVRDFDGPNGLKATASATVANTCAGSSRSWAQAYLYALEVMGGERVGLGSDVNGLAGLPGPRFGTNAAYRLEGDNYRDPYGKLRVEQAEQQSNGVRYKDHLRDASLTRFSGTAYDGDGDALLNRDIWRALGLFKSEARLSNFNFSRAENIAIGMQAGVADDLNRLVCGPLRDACYHERRAGFLVASGSEPGDNDEGEIFELYGKIQQYYARWQAMEGENYPLDRCVVGSRDFDYNLDGFAHYGMLPDFLQDLHNVGLGDEHTHSLYHSAEAYIQTWEKCGTRSTELFGAITIPSVGCE